MFKVPHFSMATLPHYSPATLGGMLSSAKLAGESEDPSPPSDGGDISTSSIRPPWPSCKTDGENDCLIKNI